MLKTSENSLINIRERCLCKNTEMIGDDIFEGNTFLIGNEDNEYELFSGFGIIKFNTKRKYSISYLSLEVTWLPISLPLEEKIHF